MSSPLESAVDALVADDDPDARALVSSALIRAGLSVREASDGRELLELFDALERHAPTRLRLVLSDIGMPLVDGIEAAQRIQARRPDLLIVLMTGFTDEATLDTAAQSGAARVMSKPVDLSELSILLLRATGNAD